MFDKLSNNKFSQKRPVLNKTPGWKYVLLIVILVLGIIYAVPNLFGEDPALQISSTIPGTNLTQAQLNTVETALKNNHLAYKQAQVDGKHILVRFINSDTRLAGKDTVAKALGDQYIVSTTDAAATPVWLTELGAHPMKLGLDLRGGMSLLLQVDVADVIKRREQNSVRNVAESLRAQHIMYTGIMPTGAGIKINFRNAKDFSDAQSVLSSKVNEFNWNDSSKGASHQLTGVLSPQALVKLREYTMQQTINTLMRRVDELGVSEAAVQQQGLDRISVDLPGVSDATEAQNILGKTATIDSYLVDEKNDAEQAAATGVVPAGDMLLKDAQGRPYLLRNQVILSGDNITSATASADPQTGQPVVNITVAGSGQNALYRATSDNIGKLMAVVYTEIKSNSSTVNGKTKIQYKKNSMVVSAATIMGAFSSNFQTTGLSAAEAQQLSLLLRAGSLPAAITVLSEHQVGPSMGKQNVERGKLSVEIGFILVVIFMALYYRAMGIIADIALFINLVLIVAVMSLLGGVMSFPGIAGIVLTVGMAVDANVLIFERIREELRNGISVQAAIHAGYDRAIVTIVDAQITSLIAAIVLFAIGTGPIKGFAIVLTIGLLTSMLTAITYTRAIVNYLYGGKNLKQLSIGIKLRKKV